MTRAVLVMALALCCARADADVLYQQAPNPAGGFYRTSWLDPDGSNYDQYVWDAFTLADSADLAAIDWRGAYDPVYAGAGGPVVDFTVAIYASIAAGTQPDVSQPPLVEYVTGGNASETYAGMFGGVAMYDYGYTLPAAFHAQAGVKYWVQIEGWQQGWFPDWGLAAGVGGDGSHFLCDHNNLDAGPDGGVPTGCYFTVRTGDCVITLRDARTTAVGDGSALAGFALDAVSPNPSRGGRIDVVFRLPDSAPATVALYDVAGRRLTSLDVGPLGAGTHRVTLAAPAPAAPGVCFVELARGMHVRHRKIALAR